MKSEEYMKTYRELEREAERIALHSAETKEQAVARLLEANPEIYAQYRAQHDRLAPKRICEALGIEERIVRQWQLRGMLKIEAQPGGGKWRHYTFTDVVCLALMKSLTHAGFSGRWAADCINDNRKLFERDPLRPLYLALEKVGGGFTWASHNQMPNLNRILEPGDSPGPGVVTVVAVHRVAQEVKTKLFQPSDHGIPVKS